MTATATFNTVAGQAEYDLSVTGGPAAPPDWKLVQDFMWGTSTALLSKSEDFIRGIDPNWLMASSGSPQYYWMRRQNVIRLYPPPGSVVACTINGVVADTDLVNPTDKPKCEDHYHRNIPRLAAWFYGEAFAQGEAAKRIDGYYQKAMAAAADLRSVEADQDMGGLQRTVRRRGVSRVYLTGEDARVINSGASA